MTTETTILCADATRLPLGDQCVDLVLGSPPYCDARTYNDGTLPEGHTVSRECTEWVEWMLEVTTEALRVCRGPVVWIAAGVTRDRNYWPACEGLMWEWFKRGGHAYRPCYWYRVGIPGSGGDQWFRADVEYCMGFKRPGPLPWTDNTAMGHPPKWAPGGEMSYRNTDGTRRNQWGGMTESNNETGERQADGGRQRKNRPSHVVTNGRDQWGGTPSQTSGVGRRKNGTHKPRQIVSNAAKARQSIESTYYQEPVLANPGVAIEVVWADSDETFWLDIHTGGGALGSTIAHHNEAPYPERVAEFFIRSLCPAGGTVLDPFSGSGTTAAVAKRTGRNAIASDLRTSQCELTRRRLQSVQPELFI